MLLFLLRGRKNSPKNPLCLLFEAGRVFARLFSDDGESFLCHLGYANLNTGLFTMMPMLQLNYCADTITARANPPAANIFVAASALSLDATWSAEFWQLADLPELAPEPWTPNTVRLRRFPRDAQVLWRPRGDGAPPPPPPAVMDSEREEGEPPEHSDDGEGKHDDGSLGQKKIHSISRGHGGVFARGLISRKLGLTSNASSPLFRSVGR